MLCQFIFNVSPKRQNVLEECISKYPNTLKTKLCPLCRTRWVERIDALETALDHLEEIIGTFSHISEAGSLYLEGWTYIIVCNEQM